MGSGSLEMSLPPVSSYLINVALGTIPKMLLIILASAIAAFRADLFSSLLDDSGRRDLPVEICTYSKDDGDYRGDRICNNALANAIVCILVAIALMMVDLLIPCLNTMYVRLAHIFSLLWEGLMAVYWLISAALLADLYSEYCNVDDGFDCEEREKKFLVLPILGFACMGGWIAVGVLSTVRLFMKK
ncbi:uncharacterized protein [Dysidea avara]|uniref:uncharacterized protein n=1 Tax=Dysidea avara TaxID=196820 RepID=UPI00331EB367